MLSIFSSEKESKSIYFHLSHSFHLFDVVSSPTYKIAGVYAIFKDGVCHYVGQSKNLPSRIATHLSGKYSNADHVKVFFAGETEQYHDNSCCFYEWNKQDQTDCLEANESLCMAYFKPIENIYIHGNGEGDVDWILNPESESVVIDIDSDTFCVYRDPFCFLMASKTLKDCYESESKLIRGVQ